MTAPAPARQQAQQAHEAVAAHLAATLTGLLATFNLRDLRGALPDIAAAVAALVHRYGQASATLAATHYLETRAAAGIPGRFTVLPADLPPLEQVAASVDWATQPLWSRDVLDAHDLTGNPKVAAAADRLTAAAERLVLDVGRQTTIGNVARDRRAHGWAREPEPGACSFCMMLATRGAVYKEHSFDAADARFVDGDTPSDIKTHNHCRCQPFPVFGEFVPSPEVKRAQDVYAGIRHGKPAAMRKAFRDAWNTRDQPDQPVAPHGAQPTIRTEGAPAHV